MNGLKSISVMACLASASAFAADYQVGIENLGSEIVVGG